MHSAHPATNHMLSDRSRSLEVTTLLGDTVLGVHHLEIERGDSGGNWIFWGLAVLGWTSFAAGGVVAVAGMFGVGTLLLLLGTGLGLTASMRLRHRQRSPHFFVGAASEADVHLDNPAIPGPCFPLVESTTRGRGINITEGMTGDVTVGEHRYSLTDLIRGGHALEHGVFPGTYRYPIAPDMRARIDMGDNTFLISSAPPAPPIEDSTLLRVDWSAQTFNGVSLSAHALVLALVFFVPPDLRVVNLDLFDTDGREVRVLVTPKIQQQEQVPAWLRNRSEHPPGKKDPGQPHAGRSGKMGSKTSKQTRKLIGVKGPEDNPDPHLSRRLAQQTARDMGIVGLLGRRSGSHLASIFGRDSALGRDAQDALGNLIGDAFGDASGMGGLGLVGTERGGGGLGEGTVGTGGPLGTLGRGGGTPDGVRYGTAVGRLAPRKQRSGPRVDKHVEVRGALDKSIIRRVIRRHINEIRYCYQNELQANPDLYGRVVVHFSILGNGQVAFARVTSSTLDNASVETCITRAVRRWAFPKPNNRGTVIVSYPFVLRSAGAP